MDHKQPPGPADYNAPPPAYPGHHQQQQQGYGQPPPHPYPAAAQPAQPGYPQQGYGPPATSATTVVVTQPNTVVMGGRLGPNPCTMSCPYCQAHITTATTRSCGGFVWMIAGIICLIGLFFMGITWFGCCLIPFCIPSLYDTTHTCPNCNRVIGEHTHF